MTYYLLDFETKYNDIHEVWFNRDPEKNATRFPPSVCHDIISFGYAKVRADYSMERLGVAVADETELEALVYFSQLMQNSTDVQIVSWNGRQFDMQVFVARCLHYGIPIKWYYDRERDIRYRYNINGHYDLFDFFIDHGTNPDRIKFDYVCKLIGLPGKGDTDGTMVWDLYKEGKIKEIVAYNIEDIIQQYVLFLRMEVLRGVMFGKLYVQRVLELEAQLQAEVAWSKNPVGSSPFRNKATSAVFPAIATGCESILNKWNLEAVCKVYKP